MFSRRMALQAAPDMERPVETALLLAEVHAAASEQCVIRQQDAVRRLQENGGRSTEAERLLSELDARRRSCRDALDWLRAALD